MQNFQEHYSRVTKGKTMINLDNLDAEMVTLKKRKERLESE